ncbi:MAG: MgtC/SapB family protein [Candidatus Thorarchaeota archaeon]
MQIGVDFLSADLVLRFLIGFVVGALIGFDRQKKAIETDILGIRSFGLHSLLGALAAYSFMVSGNPIILIYAICISIILVAFHMYQKIIRSMRKGVTTSIVFALAFVLGALVGLDVPLEGQLIGSLQVLAMTISFLVFLVLGFKQELSAAVAGVSREEMTSAAELGVIILFFYPLIPESIPIPGLPNPFPVFQIYVLIVILLSISFANYILIKKYKHRGIYFFGFFGGFANSEATVSGLTDFHVKTERRAPGRISVSTIFANLAMVLRNGFIVILLDVTLQIFTYYLIPLFILVAAGAIRLLYERTKVESQEEEEIDLNIVSPFEFGAAIRFAAVFTTILFISLVAQAIASDLGFLIASALGGIVNAGAIVATAAITYSTGGITLATAVYAVIIATTMAILNKMIFVYVADREASLAKVVGRDSMIMAIGVVIYLVVLFTGIIPIS